MRWSPGGRRTPRPQIDRAESFLDACVVRLEAAILHAETCGVTTRWRDPSVVEYLWEHATRNGRGSCACPRGGACRCHVLLVATAGRPISHPHINLNLTVRERVEEGGPEPLLYLARAIETAVADMARFPEDQTAVVGYSESGGRVYTTLGESFRGFPDGFPTRAASSWWRALSGPGIGRLAGAMAIASCCGSVIGVGLHGHRV